MSRLLAVTTILAERVKGLGFSMLSLHSDEAVEDFVATADLARYDLSGFKPMRFEIELKAATLNMRLSAFLLDAVKAEWKH